MKKKKKKQKKQRPPVPIRSGLGASKEEAEKGGAMP
jgi:hypothetical protein